MSKLFALALCLTSAAQAETVLWKATGALTTGTGVFQRQDLSPSDSVTLRITYDDDAIPDVPTPLLGRTDSDYREAINLKIEITIGSYLWEGTVSSAKKGFPYTFFTRVKDPFPTAESFDIQITSDDQGSFSSFPFRLGDSLASFFLDFNGANSSLLDSGISVGDIHPEHLSSATGKISTGVGNELSFTIDPASLEILFEKDETVAPIVVIPSISVTNNSVSLTWQSDFRFRYLIEATDDLSSETWNPIETRFGTDTMLTREYVRADHPNYFRISTLQRTDPE